MSELAFDALTPGQPMKIDVDGSAVCVVRVAEEIFAVADLCTHAEASLSDGEVSDFRIECWLHGAEFDLKTGAALTLPATTGLESFEVTKTGNSLTITKKSGAK